MQGAFRLSYRFRRLCHAQAHESISSEDWLVYLEQRPDTLFEVAFLKSPTSNVCRVLPNERYNLGFFSDALNDTLHKTPLGA